MCYNAGALPDGISFQYYFNASSYTKVDDNDVGTLVWKLPYNDGSGNQATVDQALGLQFAVNSNVASLLFGLSNYYFNVGFDKDSKLFGWTYIDDSTFTPGTNPFPSGNGTAYYQWYVYYSTLLIETSGSRSRTISKAFYFMQ